MTKDDDQAMADLDKGFSLLGKDAISEAKHEMLKKRDQQWKAADPEGYKKDMEEMCKSMCGDKWEIEYEALLKEEFPDEH